MTSKDEVSSKILTYQSQLAQVKEFLLSDPDNQQFLQLESDLNQAIALTTNLLQAQEGSEGDEEDNDDDDYGDYLNENPFGKAILPSKTGAIGIGENIEVSSGERTYAGTLLSINQAEDTGTIKYFEYAHTEVTLPLSSIHRIPAGVYLPSNLQIGMKVTCKYAQDQTYYQVRSSMAVFSPVCILPNHSPGGDQRDYQTWCQSNVFRIWQFRRSSHRIFTTFTRKEGVRQTVFIIRRFSPIDQ
jgi:hypothetical protein